MDPEWLVKSEFVHNLVRLPSGICCSLCGLVERTNDEKSEETEETALLDQVIEGNCIMDANEAWEKMERHIREVHCDSCVMCGALGTIELSSGKPAAWIRRTRTRSALSAIRGYRRSRQQRQASGQGCTHCFCHACALSAAREAATTHGACPVEGCGVKIETIVLSILVPDYQPTFDCAVCGERTNERDKVSLHNPDRMAHQGQRRVLIQDFDDVFPPIIFGNNVGDRNDTFNVRRFIRANHGQRRMHSDDIGLGQQSSPLAPSRKRPRDEESNDETSSACELCAQCAERWLAIQAREGAVYVRCPTPACRRPLSRDILEVLMSPKAYATLLKRAQTSFETRLRELQSSATRLPQEQNEAIQNDGTIDFLRWASDKTRACPSCHVIIYRSEGCSHMSCASCGAEFDWDNAERIDGSQPAPAPAPQETREALPNQAAHIALARERARAAALHHEIGRLRRRFSRQVDATTTNLSSSIGVSSYTRTTVLSPAGYALLPSLPLTVPPPPSLLDTAFPPPPPPSAS